MVVTCLITGDLLLTAAGTALALKAWWLQDMVLVTFLCSGKEGTSWLQACPSLGSARATLPSCPNLPPMCEVHA